MAYLVRLAVALGILVPFFVLVPAPPVWAIFIVAIVAFGSGRLVAQWVVPASPPSSDVR